MSATRIEYAITAVEDAIRDGTGNHRTIASQYRFDLLAWPGRAAEELAKLARKKPLAYVSTGPQRPQDTVQEMGSEARYDVLFTIECAYYWGHQGAFAELKAAEARCAGDFHRLRSALCYPDNLRVDSLGNATGLASGALRSEGAQWSVRRDVKAHLLYATAAFPAIVFIDFPT